MKQLLIALLFSGFVVAAPANAQNANMLTDFAACKSFDKKKARLRCFDEVLDFYESGNALSQEGGLTPLVAEAAENAVAAPATPEAPPAEDAKQYFGLSDLERDKRQIAQADESEREELREKKRRRDTLTDRVLQVVERADLRRVIVLESGQVWLGNGDDVLQSLSAGDDVEIRKGGVGGFRLKKRGSVGRLGVRRLD